VVSAGQLSVLRCQLRSVEALESSDVTSDLLADSLCHQSCYDSIHIMMASVLSDRRPWGPCLPSLPLAASGVHVNSLCFPQNCAWSSSIGWILFNKHLLNSVYSSTKRKQAFFPSGLPTNSNYMALTEKRTEKVGRKKARAGGVAQWEQLLIMYETLGSLPSARTRARAHTHTHTHTEDNWEFISLLIVQQL
jgi:hypothetical protein